MGKKKVCMIVQDKMVKGGIAAVISGYYGSKLEQDYDIIYVESYRDGGKLTKLLKGLKGYFEFFKVLIFDKPDLIHIHSSFGPSFYRKMPFIYMASWVKKPIINHIHGADFDKFYVNASEKNRRQIKKVYNKCSELIALSAEWKEHLSQIVPNENIKIIENYGILHKDAIVERTSRSSNNTVLFLGELGKRKGCYDIPAVTEKVVKEVPEAKFVLGGAGSVEDEAAIKKLFEERGVADHVVFPGWVRGDKKDKLLRDADVFFLPSYNEGMPMSVLDAMGYGLPVVSTNVGGISKIVHDGENGTCCDAGDIETFTCGIIELLKYDDVRKKCAQNSYEILVERYSLEAHLKLLEEVYEKVAE